VQDLSLRANLLGGGACTVNISDTSSASGISGIALQQNTFQRGTSQLADCAMLVTARSAALTSSSGNVWDDGSQPTPAVRVTG
jgi:hypothetical protein